MRFGGPGRAAREHADRDPGPGLADGWRTRAAPRRPRVPRARRDRRADGRQGVGWQQREVVGLTDEQRKVERRQIGAEPLGAEERVHGDDARARAQQPEERTERRRAVAQHEADRRSHTEARLPQGGVDLIGRRREVAPRVPTPAELERGRRAGRALITAASRSGNPLIEPSG